MKLEFKKQYRVELAPTLSSHWYSVWEKKKNGKEKFLGYFASSTTILNAYPQSQFLTKWIADNGWSESQRIKSEAGERGTRIHSACDALENGQTLMKENNYSLEEWVKIKSFVDWHNEYKPELIAMELPVFSSKGKYAGRLDRLYNIAGEVTVLDIKSGSGLHEHFPLQFASYAKALEENTNLKIIQTAALQLGAPNKNGYRFVIYPDWKDHYKVFEHVHATWKYEYFDSKKNPKEPPVLVLPGTLSLNNTPKVTSRVIGTK